MIHGPLALRTVLLAIAFGLASPAFAADRCAAPDEITANTAPLSHVGQVLSRQGALNVLTVGSATVFSPDESIGPGTITGLALGLSNIPKSGDLMPSDAAFPMQMANALRQSNPGLKVVVTVKGGRGMLASEMLAIIRSELAAHSYQLVIWQTGTVEAVRNVPSGEFFQTLSDGAATASDAGADLVLVDPQFSRFLHANADVDPYTQALQQVAGQVGVVLFHRFELMRYWSAEGQIDLERTPKSRRTQTVEVLHACLGASLARFVAASANLPP